MMFNAEPLTSVIEREEWAMMGATLTGRFCIAACLVIGSGPAVPGDELVNCLLVIRVNDAGQLRTLTDKQLENGLCMMSKQAVLAIAARNEFEEVACVRATESLLKEFYRRFPRRDAKEVAAGKC